MRNTFGCGGWRGAERALASNVLLLYRWTIICFFSADVLFFCGSEMYVIDGSLVSPSAIGAGAFLNHEMSLGH